MKEIDIRSDEKVRQYYEREGEWLQRHAGSDGLIRKEYLQPTSCPTCGTTASTEKMILKGFHIVECRECATDYVNPTFTPEMLQKFYEDPECRGNYDEVLTSGRNGIGARLEHIFMPRRRKVESMLQASGRDLAQTRLVDVGCASGQFLSVFDKTGGPQLHGVELDPRLAEISRKSLPHAKIFNSLYEKSGFEEGYFDAVTIWEVLEHIRDPLALLKSIHRTLRKGGHFFVSVPNLSGFDVQILSDIKFYYTPPSHLNYFKRESFHILLERAGFKVHEITTPGKLDVDIVRKRMGEHPGTMSKIGSYFANALKDESAEGQVFREKLQLLLAETGRSSHMQAVAIKI